MRLTPETIDDLRDIALLDAVTKYNDITLKKSGPNSWVGKSPWVDEKTPSFYVIPAKNIYKDFSTGKGGNNAISFVMEKEGVDFMEACKILARDHGVELKYDRSAPPPEPEKKINLQAAWEWACAHFGSHEVPDAFKKLRGFPEPVYGAFKIGYAKAGWDDLLKSAKTADISVDALLQAGLIRKREKREGHYDAFRDRVMIPVMDYRGHIVGYTGRDAETEPPKEGLKVAKYVHTEGMEKSRHLFGLYQAIKGGRLKECAYLVEGPTDVIRWHGSDITNTVGKLGSDFSEEQAKLLKRFADKIVLVPDNDCDKPKNAGVEAMHRNAEIALKAGFQVKYLIPGIRK